MTAPLLHRLPSTGRYDKRYRIHGFDHLVVEAYYSDAEDSKPEFGCWWVLDTRFSVLDGHGRQIVISATYLSDIRSWLKAGGARIWDPEKRVADKNWKPAPEGWMPDDERMTATRRTPFRPFGEKGSRAVEGASRAEQFSEPSDHSRPTVTSKPKRYAVAPGWITSANDRQRHWIGFGALTWLYGVDPAECLLADGEKDRGWSKEFRESLIWLYPMYRHEDYEALKQELARGDDAFKLIEP